MFIWGGEREGCDGSESVGRTMHRNALQTMIYHRHSVVIGSVLLASRRRVVGFTLDQTMTSRKLKGLSLGLSTTTLANEICETTVNDEGKAEVLCTGMQYRNLSLLSIH